MKIIIEFLTSIISNIFKTIVFFYLMWNCASGFMVKKLTQKVSDFWLTLDSINSSVFLFVFIIMSVYSSIYLSLCKSFYIIMHFLFRHTGESLNLIYLSICCTYCISTFLYSLAQNFRVTKIFIKCRLLNLLIMECCRYSLFY